jgi:hypothetical protein
MHETLWICEKWGEEACEFARKRLDRAGVSHIPGSLKQVGNIVVPSIMAIKDGISSQALREIVGPPEEAIEIAGNLLLNEGIQRLQDMTMIATVVSNQVAANPWSNANAFTGVGDSNAAEAATQTELSAATNRFYKAMNAAYPSRASQTVSFQSDFTGTEANYVWAEWTIAASATTASGAGFLNGTVNLNRKVAALGTKSSGTWTLTSQITLS